MKEEWENVRAWDCRDDFRADALYNFFPRTCCPAHIQHDKREPGLFKEEFRATEMIALNAKTYACYDEETDHLKFSCKGVNKNLLDDPLPKYRKVLDKRTNIKSHNRGFRTMNNSIHTYDLTKFGLSYFYAKRKVADDGIHTSPLDL